MSPDPRHGGLAHYYPGVLAGGHTGCDGEINARIGFPDDTGSHEFGHVMGLHHGAPRADCFNNPFAPQHAADGLREDKLVQASHMNYAFNNTYLLANREALGAQVFSIGRNIASPLPRAVTVAGREVLGWPEFLTFNGLETRHLAIWRTLAGVTVPPAVCPASADFLCADFDRSGAAGIDTVVTGPAEPALGFSAGGTKPFWLNNYRCENEGLDGTPNALVTAGLECCPLGTTARNGQCLTSRFGRPTAVARTYGVLNSLMNQAMQAPLVIRTAVNQPRRMVSLYLDDVLSSNSNDRSARTFTGTGKIRFWSLGKIEFPSNTTAVPRCAGDSADCARLPEDWRGRGDLPLESTTWTPTVMSMNGPGTIAAAAIERGPGALERVLVGRASRSGLVCMGTDGVTPQDCPWVRPSFALGSSDALEPVPAFVSHQASLQSRGTLGFDFDVSGLAMVPWSLADGSPSQFFIVARRADTDELYWRQCNGRGDCTGPAAVLRDSAGMRIQSEGQIALALQPSVGGRQRLALMSTSVGLFGGGLVFREIPTSGGEPRTTEPRIILDGNKARGEQLFILSESALSAAFTRSGNLVLGFESDASRTSLGTSTADPFLPGDIRVLSGAKDWSASRRVALGSSYAVSPRTGVTGRGEFFASPGNTWAVFRDDRPTEEAIGVSPTGERDPYLDRNFTGVVRGFGVEYYTGIYATFAAQVDGTPLSPRYDYDESTTLVYAMCHTLESSSRGVRGGGLAPRLRTANSNNRVLCPGASAWNEPPSNRIVPEFLVRPIRFRPSEALGEIAEMLISPSWYGAATQNAQQLPQIPPAIPPVNRCSVGGEDGAWMEALRQSLPGGPQ
ncbi:MAG: hypothetical protein Q8Q09_05955 [Deltaproteobacteria bacterium]|nr:hypothetical protein [Deltaproteobacteria bacterium]